MIYILKHFITITKHRHKVITHCFRAGIPFQGFFHDLSKYSPTEFIPGAKFYQGNRSPNEREREICGYSKAWMHHKGRNLHHFEYWNDINRETKLYEPVEMPLNYLTEMFCDRVAASKIYRGKAYTDSCPLEYFLNSSTRKRMHRKTADILEEWLYMLSEKGEKIAFQHIKAMNRAAKHKEIINVLKSLKLHN